MSIKLNCPVCGYKEVQGNICPNCDTDLSVIRRIQELPPVEQVLPQENPWTKGVAILMLMIGITVGAGGSFFALQNNFHNASISNQNASTVANVTPATTAPVVRPTTPEELRTYTVKSGDTLSKIAAQFCGNAGVWQQIVQVNPELKQRESKINIGEVLKIPSNCKGGVNERP
ncbi:hypothetical protein B6N60_03565 [Richelia sinica FACHB-800]|jgi:LysM repeat protein|uniref:LysM domain-containing protein n=1 Tax=Richelia sinica FACHB-800 TaxID=1357546 RepID=A0A975Y628_9NOST|nr:LysM peptidoglycan-binding domain-containing protein [Richelia sinica]MBD2667103.1 LysM peptidoglycan-binding domain-containing protein [Richelia sinica FACHB-800]QXE24855.1 hypothetical protein B6N60_03565 [Richelia sinica FACHB-800]